MFLDKGGQSSLTDSEEARRRHAEWLCKAKSWTPPDKPTDGTGRWFLEHSRFLDWVEGTFRALYCRGLPGSGKTTLMTVVYQFLELKCRQDQDCAVVRFHSNHEIHKTMELIDIASYLLGKLVEQRALRQTTDNLRGYLSNIPEQADILHLLSAEINSYGRVYFLLDALDEMPDDVGPKVRSFLVMELPAKLSILCTFRHNNDNILASFQPADGPVEVTAQQDDVEKYVADWFKRQSLLGRLAQKHFDVSQAEAIKKLAEKLIERSTGIFIVVRLIMQHLDTRTKKDPNVAAFQSALDSAPKTADEMYDLTIRRSPNEATTRRLLSIVMLTGRPLSLEELRHFVAWSRSDTSQDLDERTVDDEEAFVDRCVGLVTFRDISTVVQAFGQSSWDDLDYKGGFLIHKTLNEYLIQHSSKSEDILTNDQVALLAFDFLKQHLSSGHLAQSSSDSVTFDQPRLAHYVRKLLRVPFLIRHRPAQYGPMNHAHDQLPPLLVYCAQYWFWHVERCPGNQAVISSAASLFSSKYSALVQLKRGVHGSPHECLRYAISERLTPLITELVKLVPEQLNIMVYEKTPLHLACREDTGDYVNTLLLHGQKTLELNTHGSGGRTPLLEAGYLGNLQPFKRLLTDERVDAARSDDVGYTALHYASMNDWLDAATSLSGKGGVDLNARTNSGRTPLHFAAFHGANSVVQLLLSLDTIPQGTNAPESRTSISKRKEGVILIDPQDCEGRTPLMLACQKGHVDVVRTLLSHQGWSRVDVSGRDDEKKLAKDYAENSKAEGDELMRRNEIVRMLEKHARLQPDPGPRPS